jgi:phage terminase small subunit
MTGLKMADTETLKPKELSEQQRRFADFILQGKNQRDAYRLAGYKTTNDDATDAAASRLLSNVRVEEYLKAKREKVAAKVELSAEHFAKRLERIAAAAERTLFVKTQQIEQSPDDETLDVSAKEAADIAGAQTMNAAKLLGKIIDRSASTVTISHADRLKLARERIHGRREQPTAH